MQDKADPGWEGPVTQVPKQASPRLLGLVQMLVLVLQVDTRGQLTKLMAPV
jgi:hypothetical protein